MKKLSFIVLVLISTMTLSTGANGQNDLAAADDKIVALSSNAENHARLPMEINIRALRYFKKEFPGVTNDVWTKSKDGYLVGFYVNGIQNRLLLSENGSHAGLIRYYSEKEMPAEVRHLVKSTYYDYSIFAVTEVTTAGKTVYLVTIEDSTKWKMVRVADGEMKVWEQYTKG